MNRVQLMGNLTADPEIRYTPKGQAVCEFTIAYNERWRTESGEEKERVSFLGCYMWGKRGEAFAQYHRKGNKALVEGKLVQQTWDDKETGKKQSKTKIEVTEWHFLPGREGGAERTSTPATRSEAPRTGGDRGASVATAPRGSQTPLEAPDEDDVPF